MADAPNPGGSSIDGRSGAILVIGALIALICAVALFFGRGRQRRMTVQRALADDVAIGLGYLAEQVEGLPEGDAASNAASDEARERLSAARALAAESDAVAVLRAVRHTVLEGLAAAHAARAAAGLDAGPTPPPPSEVPITDQAADVTVDGLTWVVQPAYRPGFVHHFPGGKLAGVLVPGGWYSEPFWERLLTTD